MKKLTLLVIILLLNDSIYAQLDYSKLNWLSTTMNFAFQPAYAGMQGENRNNRPVYI